MSECCAAIQRNLDKHEEWEDKHLMEFNNVKCKVLHMGKSKQMHWYKLGNNWLVLPAVYHSTKLTCLPAL